MACAAAHAALVRIEVLERSDVLEGRAFGPAGPYERIVGKAYFAVDPTAEANRIVRDVERAPRNEQGLVEFSSDIYVLKPRDPARGNGAVLYEVSNRGKKRALDMFNRAASSMDPRTAAHFGDGLLLERGYTLLWLGWQFDVPPGADLMRLYAPVLKGVRGPVRAEIVVDEKVTRHSLADRDHVAYPVADPADPKLTLTVRDTAYGPRRPVPRSAWRIVDGTAIEMPGGFEPGRLYELVYTSRDPAVAGLGPAAVRDAIAFLKYGGNDATMLGDHRRYIKRAYGFGISQSGRFLRTFLYYGFNRDEEGRKVFDGVLAHVAGGGRGSFNHRFAQPSRDGHPFFNILYPTDVFPFTDLEEADPQTGLKDGILTHNTPPEARPKIFYTNSSYEYYGRAVSLIHTTPDGAKDFPIPPGTRIYFFAGGQHGPAAFPPARNGTQAPANPNPYTWSMRALLGAMDAWVREGKAPPPSMYPRIADKTLAPLDAVRFPKIPGVSFPARIQTAFRVDYGPRFASEGIVTKEPPTLGKPFAMRVPQVDEDGNETSGVRMPQLEAPLATYTGWNLRAPGIGAPQELFSMVGAFLPFPRTRAERRKTADPRRSIEERYATRAEYLERFGAAARRLAERGYLLDRDVPALIERAGAEWDYVTGTR